MDANTYSSNFTCGSYAPCDDCYSTPDLHSLEAAKEIQRRLMAQQISDITTLQYQNEILDHMLETETRTAPNVQAIDLQTEVQWHMRPYLLDFLIEAHRAFELLPETLFLMVNILDRYCSKRVVFKRHYQLVGCVALFIAAKYGDRKDRVPTIPELASLCSSSYDEVMFQQIERHMLKTLDWSIGYPTVDAFLKMAMGSVPDPLVEHMALYIAEMAMFHRKFVATPPSLMAKTALALARSILDRPQPYSNEWASGYSQTLGSCLCSHLYEVSPVVLRKYSSPALSDVTSIMTVFIRHQIALYRRQSEHMQSEAAAISKRPSVHVTKPVGASVEPQTPHTNGYDQSVMAANGCLTPPITPDPSQLVHTNPSVYDYNKGHPQVNPQLHYYTPSPSPVGEHPQQGQHPMQQQNTCMQQQPTPMSVQYASSYIHNVPSHGHLHPQSSYSNIGMS